MVLKINHLDTNGWISVDFIVASMIFIFVIPRIIAASEDRIDTPNTVQEMVEARMLAENIAETIEMVYSGGNGCSIIYKMQNISNKKYNIKINSLGVYIKVNDKMANAYIKSHNRVFKHKYRA